MYGQGGVGLSTLPLVRFHRGLRGKMYSSLSFEHLFTYVSPLARCGAGKTAILPIAVSNSLWMTSAIPRRKVAKPQAQRSGSDATSWPQQFVHRR